jgi:DNA-binding transcriptional LysR family regulator
MLNLHHLRIFYAVAKRMSYTRAAEDLCITQPAVTNQVRVFEEQLQLRLFEVRSGKILLTQEGKILQEYARRLFDLEGDIEQVVSDLKGSRTGVISLGTSRTYSQTFLHLLIGYFHKFHPDVTVKVDEAGSLDIIQGLLNFEYEIAICVRAAENPNIRFVPFCTEELVVVLPAGHKLTGQDHIAMKDLAEEKIILRSKGSASRQIVDELYGKSNLVPRVLTEANNTELIKNMVQRGEGISFLSRIAVSKEVDEGKLSVSSLEDGAIALDISIAYLKNHSLSPSAGVFLDVLLGLLPESGSIGSASKLITKLRGPTSGEA